VRRRARPDGVEGVVVREADGGPEGVFGRRRQQQHCRECDPTVPRQPNRGEVQSAGGDDRGDDRVEGQHHGCDALSTEQYRDSRERRDEQRFSDRHLPHHRTVEDTEESLGLADDAFDPVEVQVRVVPR